MYAFQHQRRAVFVLWMLLVIPLAFGRMNDLRAESPVSGRAHIARVSESFTGREFVRNGTLDGGRDDWGQLVVQGSGWVEVQSGGPTGNYLRLYALGGLSTIQAYQQLFLPTQTNAATLSFDYRLTTPNTLNPVGALAVALVSDTLIGSWVVESNVSGDTGWRSYQYTLTSSEIDALQAARDAKKPVYLVFELGTNLEYEAYLDNVSLALDGAWTYPSLQGQIAFSSVANGRPALRVANADGSGQRTVWQVPATAPNASAATFYGLQWKPNSTELVFASTHEYGTSNYKSDLYALNTSTGAVKRLTNGPGIAEIQSGGYGRGRVTGQVRHAFFELKNVTSFLVYVQGAEAPVSVPLGSYGQTASFTIDNAADLGGGQYITFIWGGLLDTNGDGIGDKNCTSITRVGTTVDVQANQTVNVGTLDFTDSTACLQYEASAPTWRPDGSKVGFLLDSTPVAVDPNGTLDSQGPFQVSGVAGIGEFAWNPQDATKLAYSVPAGTGAGLYRINEGGTSGTLLTNAIANIWDLDWLPDGSGIIFTDGYDLYLYNFSDGQSYQLTALNLNRDPQLVAVVGYPLRDLAVSPDGTFVVFSRRGPGDFLGGDAGVDYSLWVLNLQNVTEMWQVVGKANNANRYVDWAALPSMRYTFLPFIVR